MLVSALQQSESALCVHISPPSWVSLPPPTLHTQWNTQPLCSAASWCLTLCDSMDRSLPVSSVHGISQARILEWVAISFSRGSSQPRGQICVSCIIGRLFNTGAIWETHSIIKKNEIGSLVQTWMNLETVTQGF